MEYILEKKGYNKIKVSSSGAFPGETTYNWLFEYIRNMINGRCVLANIEYKDHTIFISKVKYEPEYSFLYDEILRIDSSLENDFRFMEGINNLINLFIPLKDEISKNIETKRKEINDCRARTFQKINIVSYLKDAIVEYSKTGAITRFEKQDETLLREVIEERCQDRSLKSILFPSQEDIYADTKVGKIARGSFYISLGALAFCIIGTLTADFTNIPLCIADAITFGTSISTGAITTSYDKKKVSSVLNIINQYLDKDKSNIAPQTLKKHS